MPERDFALLDHAFMHDDVAEFLLRGLDAKTRALRAQLADVADLSAGLAVKRRLIER